MTDPLVAAKARYEAERQKRLRADGTGQYSIFEGEHDRFDADPWAGAPEPREPISEETDVVVLGGGFSGMLTTIELKKQGFESIRVLEKGADFGGTWYWNRYPGCRCDVESYIYMPYLEETGYMPSERYATAPEIFEHCQRIGNHFELYQHALFQTEITSAVWQEDHQRWEISTSRGDRLRSRFMILAGGLLFKAKLPAIEGINTFEGTTFHTARWNYAHTGGSPTEPMTDIAGKRVGIIGTGATAVQVVPKLAEAGAEVFVFQRTPAAVGVRGNRPTDEAWFRSLPTGWQVERTKNFTAAVSGDEPDVDMVQDGWTDLMWRNTQRAGATPEETEALERDEFETMERVRDRVAEVVADPETAEKLQPWWGKYCKRICFHDEYLAAFNEPKVHLVDTDGAGVHEVTERGPVVDGQEYPLDMLIFASGFEILSGYTRRLGFDPIGRDDVALSDRWANGAHTLHGVMTAQFPNMFMASITQASSGTNFVHFISEIAAHIAALAARCRDNGIIEIEPEPEAEDEWLHFLWRKASKAARGDYSAACTPSYFNNEGVMTEAGARNVVYPGNMAGYVDHINAWLAQPTLEGVRTVITPRD